MQLIESCGGDERVCVALQVLWELSTAEVPNGRYLRPLKCVIGHCSAFDMSLVVIFFFS